MAYVSVKHVLVLQTSAVFIQTHTSDLSLEARDMVLEDRCGHHLTDLLFSLCRYQSVLSACCLRPDLALLPNADLTEVTSLPVCTLL